MRTTRPSPLPDAERRPARAVRLYRGVLQHPPQAFGAGVSLPCCVREEVHPATGHDLTSYCPPNWGNSTVQGEWQLDSRLEHDLSSVASGSVDSFATLRFELVVPIEWQEILRSIDHE